jgi:chromosome segregation and condensation protein ScpB
MLLHSIVPFEMIFGDTENQGTELKEVKGGYVVLTKANGKSQVSRVISTDPKMYLSNKYKIGETFKD